MHKSNRNHQGVFHFWQSGPCLCLRAMALLLSLFFIFPSINWAFNTSNYMVLPNNQIKVKYLGNVVQVPEKYAKVEDSYQGSHKQLIIHIQDLHCHHEVQKNIAAVIDDLAQKHHLRLVGEEGAFETVNLTKIKSFPMHEVRDQVADYFVRQGKLTGAEFYAGTGRYPIEVVGIETAQLYQDSEKALHTFLTNETLGTCFDLREQLELIKPILYHPGLLEFDQKRQAYLKNEIELLAYCRFLQKQAQKVDLNLEAYPDFSRFISVKTAVFGPDLEAEKFYREIDEIDQAIRSQLYYSEQEKELDHVYRRLDMMEKLFNISATPDELNEFKKNRKAFSVETFTQFIKRHLPENEFQLDPSVYMLDQQLKNVEVFYQLAQARSIRFVDNLVSKMADRDETIAVMVSGGFHTREILEELKQRQLSYISIKPNITRQDKINPYFNLLSNQQTPLEKLLARNQNIFSIRTSCPDGKQAFNAVVPMNEIADPGQKNFSGELEFIMENAAVMALKQAGFKLQKIVEKFSDMWAKHPGNEPGIGVDLNKTFLQVNSDENAGALLIPTYLKDGTDPIATVAVWNRFWSWPKKMMRTVQKIDLGNLHLALVKHQDAETVRASLNSKRQANRFYQSALKGLSGLFNFPGKLFTGIGQVVLIGWNGVIYFIAHPGRWVRRLVFGMLAGLILTGCVATVNAEQGLDAKYKTNFVIEYEPSRVKLKPSLDELGDVGKLYTNFLEMLKNRQPDGEKDTYSDCPYLTPGKYSEAEVEQRYKTVLFESTRKVIGIIFSKSASDLQKMVDLIILNKFLSEQMDGEGLDWDPVVIRNFLINVLLKINSKDIPGIKGVMAELDPTPKLPELLPTANEELNYSISVLTQLGNECSKSEQMIEQNALGRLRVIVEDKIFESKVGMDYIILRENKNLLKKSVKNVMREIFQLPEKDRKDALQQLLKYLSTIKQKKLWHEDTQQTIISELADYIRHPQVIKWLVEHGKIPEKNSDLLANLSSRQFLEQLSNGDFQRFGLSDIWIDQFSAEAGFLETIIKGDTFLMSDRLYALQRYIEQNGGQMGKEDLKKWFEVLKKPALESYYKQQLIENNISNQLDNALHPEVIIQNHLMAIISLDFLDNDISRLDSTRLVRLIKAIGNVRYYKNWDNATNKFGFGGKFFKKFANFNFAYRVTLKHELGHRDLNVRGVDSAILKIVTLAEMYADIYAEVNENRFGAFDEETYNTLVEMNERIKEILQDNYVAKEEHIGGVVQLAFIKNQLRKLNPSWDPRKMRHAFITILTNPEYQDESFEQIITRILGHYLNIEQADAKTKAAFEKIIKKVIKNSATKSNEIRILPETSISEIIKSIGGIMTWLKERAIKWWGIAGITYDRWLAFLLENKVALAASGLSLGLPLFLISGNIELAAKASYFWAWPIFVAMHFVENSKGERASASNSAIAVMIALINIWLGTTTLAWPLILVYSFLPHFTSNFVGSFFPQIRMMIKNIFSQPEAAVTAQSSDDLTTSESNKQQQSDSGWRHQAGSNVLRRLSWLDRLPFVRRAWLMGLGAMNLSIKRVTSSINQGTNLDTATINQSPLIQEAKQRNFAETDATVIRSTPQQVEIRLLTPAVGWFNYWRGLLGGFYEQGISRITEQPIPVIYLPKSVLAPVLSVSKATAETSREEVLQKIAVIRLEQMLQHQSAHYYGLKRWQMVLEAWGLGDMRRKYFSLPGEDRHFKRQKRETIQRFRRNRFRELFNGAA